MSSRPATLIGSYARVINEGHKTWQSPSARLNVCEPTPAHRRLSWSIDDSSAYWHLPFSLLSPPHIGQSGHVCSWVVRCSCVVDPYSMLCIVDWAGSSLFLMRSLSTWSSRHPDVEVVCYCHRGQCYMRKLGRAPIAHSCLKPMHRRVRLQCCKHWRSDHFPGLVDMMVEEGVSRTDLVVVSEHGQPSCSSMTQTRYNLYNSQAGETNVHYVTAAHALDYRPPRDGITCLSIDSGPPGLPLLINAISWQCCAKGNACKAANCCCNCVKLGFHGMKLSWNVYCPCTAGNTSRTRRGMKNSTVTIMGMTWSRWTERGRRWPAGWCYLMREPRRKLGHLQLLYAFFNNILNYVNTFMQWPFHIMHDLHHLFKSCQQSF